MKQQYKVKKGTHVEGRGNDRKLYHAGDIVTSEQDLAKLFYGKFEHVGAAPAEVEEPETPQEENQPEVEVSKKKESKPASKKKAAKTTPKKETKKVEDDDEDDEDDWD